MIHKPEMINMSIRFDPHVTYWFNTISFLFLFYLNTWSKPCSDYTHSVQLLLILWHTY